MIKQNGLIGLHYCGLVAPTSLLIFVRIYVLFVDAREWKKTNAICWENSDFSSATPVKRVEEMFKQILEATPSQLEIILCVLPKRKNSDIYVMTSFSAFISCWGFPFLQSYNQSMLFYIVKSHGRRFASPANINSQYLTNLLLKINSKVNMVTLSLTSTCIAYSKIFYIIDSLCFFICIAWRNIYKYINIYIYLYILQ